MQFSMASPCLLRAEITGVHHPAQLLDFKGVAGVWEGDLVSFILFYFCIKLASCLGKAGAGVCACWKREPEEWRAASEPGSHLRGWGLSIAGH